MASVVTDPGGRKRILFVDPDGRRRAIRLGKVNIKAAESVCRHVEALLAAAITGQPVRQETAVWVSGIGGTLRDKLAAVGLVEPPCRAALGEFLERFILSRPDVKPATLEIWKQPCRNLTEFFGEGKSLRSITPGDAEQFKQWLMTQGLAAATVAKRLAFSRTFLHVARKHKLVDENPFAEVKIPAANVSTRQRFVNRDTTDRLLNAAAPTWRTIIALARLGGLRCPSEVLSLEWRHVDWERDRITVPSPKTERHDGKASRMVPLFADLRPYLQEAFELAEPGQVYVVGGPTGDGFRRAATRKPGQWMNANLRTTFTKIIKRCGLEPWPRLFHNLRSSRETELLEMFPVHVVAAWLGHDAKVSIKHYAQVTENHFELAAGKSVAKSGALGAQKAAQQVDAANGTVLNAASEKAEYQGSNAETCELVPSGATLAGWSRGDLNP